MRRKDGLINPQHFKVLHRKRGEHGTAARLLGAVRVAMFASMTLGEYIALIGRNGQTSENGKEDVDRLVGLLQDRQQRLRAHLNEQPVTRLRRFLSPRYRDPVRNERLKDPVRIKHLEQTASLLQVILLCLQSPDGARLDNGSGKELLNSLLDQLENPAELSTQSAWELAGLGEITLVELASDPYLCALLRGVSNGANDDSSGNDTLRLRRFPYADDWEKHFPSEDLQKLLGQYKNAKFRREHIRRETKGRLAYLYMTRWDEYRHDRARIQLLAKYARRLAFWLVLLVPALYLSYIAASIPFPYDEIAVRNHFIFNIVPFPDLQDSNTLDLISTALHEQYLAAFVFFAGAVGSVLGRLLNFVRYKANASRDEDTKKEEASRDKSNEEEDEVTNPYLGLRELTSEVRNVITQPLIGGATALILYFTLKIGTFTQLSVAAYGIAGFLAGFSEGFFQSNLKRLGGMISPRT